MTRVGPQRHSKKKNTHIRINGHVTSQRMWLIKTLPPVAEERLKVVKCRRV